MNDATISNIPTSTPATPSTTAAQTTNPTVSIPSPAAASTVTPGWKTSEFWMTAIGQIGLALAAASGALPAKYAVLAGALGQAAYSVSRGMAKSTPAPAN